MLPKGVKHLHHKAVDFDIGVYFEANGHGTVIFSPKALTIIEGVQPKTCVDFKEICMRGNTQGNSNGLGLEKQVEMLRGGGETGKRARKERVLR